MEVTSHSIYNGILESTIIGVQDLHESHDAKYLGKTLEDMCNKWSISNIVAVISDNAANITKTIKDTFTTSGQLPCMAHTLNLVVSESLEKIGDLKLLLDNVKDIVTYFKRCVNAADDLKKETGDDFLKPTRLVQSVVTRWNSTFCMLRRFLLLKTEVASVLSKYSKAPTMLDGGNIEILEKTCKILEPFEVVTREICGEKYETCGKIIPNVYNLLHNNRFFQAD
ncbi:Similar to ZBED4: Zinc finger BED domain-containing protein 4 (Homo sapiens) [Cotesia congregata]|uniref:Similar to ZBED4: Zinc finger BED domain-containing protein 4 (Homo sapiens) n=1 Tax=Cotesia congregata TaxID=51543 RepID=A0A8J2HQ47_COTCN|nr:Similar to ZBED4: Zinc finger BED domain-containing protein 4 (Homo sapiens) [Cotesia congregata]